MKKILAFIGSLALALVIIGAAKSDPNPPPGYIQASVEKFDIVNTYSDPNPPPGYIGL